ncbi:hypothetical protein F2P47_08805 [Parvibaculum sedimenti]|uniref:Uncharacterized protein n=1 Tax=Parvibaculum sedimenti TaxID=2608632 RepID=A0A6N6VM58_9HYPH|nr:hypothetical protein F2P47_08805 [Parvibaculum sedimenti]
MATACRHGNDTRLENQRLRRRSGLCRRRHGLRRRQGWRRRRCGRRLGWRRGGRCRRLHDDGRRHRGRSFHRSLHGHRGSLRRRRGRRRRRRNWSGCLGRHRDGRRRHWRGGRCCGLRCSRAGTQIAVRLLRCRTVGGQAFGNVFLLLPGGRGGRFGRNIGQIGEAVGARLSRRGLGFAVDGGGLGVIRNRGASGKGRRNESRAPGLRQKRPESAVA